MVEVTVRTVHGRFLLRPSRAVNDLVVGVIGRAQKKYGMKIHALAVLSNHLQGLLTPDSPQQLAAFMNYVCGNLAREIGRLHDWREKFWARTYRAIVVSDEPDTQSERLAYILSQGVKEGLVERPQALARRALRRSPARRHRPRGHLGRPHRPLRGAAQG